MSELDKIRENINSIDEQMAQLFQERMEMSRQVAAFKKDRGLSIRDAERERELIDRNRRSIRDPAVAAYYVQFLRGILDLSCAYQSRLLNGMKVAYSGVEGAYGYIAARRMFPEAQLIAYPDFAAAHRAVEQGEADSAVLPLENSYAGEVGAVMDLLFSGELYINQVMDLEIDHSLLGVEGAAKLLLGEMKKAFLSSTKSKLGALLIKDSLGDVKKLLDPSEVGGTPFLGISKPVLKAHGSSDARAIRNAVFRAVEYAQSGIIADVEAHIDVMKVEKNG